MEYIEQKIIKQGDLSNNSQNLLVLNKKNDVNEIKDNNHKEFEENKLFNLDEKDKKDPILLNNENSEENYINDHNDSTIDKSHHSKAVNLTDTSRISNSICIISIPTYKGKNMGTCFFMYIKNKKYLITNSHVIPERLIERKKIVEVINNIGEKFSIKLDKEERIIICISKPYDITAIEILEKDKLDNIKYLEYVYDDMNKYINKEVFILQHPEGKELHIASGIIKNIDETIFEFEHTLDTDYGSSGSPVLLNENYKVIGIHKKRIKENDNKKGTFIGKLIETIIDESNKSPYLFLNKINDMNEITGNNDNDELAENNLLILKYYLDIEDPIML